MIRELCSSPVTGDALHANGLRDLHAASVCQPGGNRDDNQCSSLSLSLSLSLSGSSMAPSCIKKHILKNASCMDYILNISRALRLDADLLLHSEKINRSDRDLTDTKHVVVHFRQCYVIQSLTCAPAAVSERMSMETV